MPSVTSLLDAINERTIARRIGIPHDEARMRYALSANTVDDFEAFTRVIADYYNYHFTSCVSYGGSLSAAEAASRAKEILEREYRRRNGTIVTAFNNAHDGTSGGLRGLLDMLAENLKAESVRLYMRHMFDTHVAPNSFDDKVEIIRDFISFCGPLVADSIDASRPERYAYDYEPLIRSYVQALEQTSSMFRRL